MKDIVSESVLMGPVELLTGYYLRRVEAIFHAEFNKTMSETGIRQIIFGVLSVTSANPGISQGKLGEALGIQRNNMATLAAELEGSGLITRAVADGNRRQLSLNITKSGQDVLSKYMDVILEQETRIMSNLTECEQMMLVMLLKKVLKN